LTNDFTLFNREFLVGFHFDLSRFLQCFLFDERRLIRRERISDRRGEVRERREL
jgi:hypothetical protein